MYPEIIQFSFGKHTLHLLSHICQLSKLIFFKIYYYTGLRMTQLLWYNELRVHMDTS